MARPGALKVLPPLSKAGDRIVFEAKMDLVIGLTACSALDSQRRRRSSRSTGRSIERSRSRRRGVPLWLRRGRGGGWLIYWWRHGRWPDLDRPRRFTEWVQWRKLNDRRHGARAADRQGTCRARRWRGDARHVVPTLWSGRDLPRDRAVAAAVHRQGQSWLRAVRGGPQRRLIGAAPGALAPLWLTRGLWRLARRMALSARRAG